MKTLAIAIAVMLAPLMLVLSITTVAGGGVAGSPLPKARLCAPQEACATPGAAAVAWAESQIGAPYAAINPYRLGSPAWPGGTLTGIRGDRYSFPAGAVVFDCSGLVIAAWQRAGIDVVTSFGIVSSQQFGTSALADAPIDALEPGDIAVYRPTRNGIGHVVLIHHIDTTGVVWTIEAAPAKGVHTDQLDWTRVIAVKRPAIAR